MSPFILSVEGNIGSGKSTFVKYLQSNFRDIIFLQEPVNEWSKITDSKGETILSKFYKDQQSYSFSFQMMAYISRLALIKETVKNNPNAIIVTERCLLTDKQVFAQMLYDEEKIEDINYDIYLKWFDTFYDDYPISHYVYLQTSPQVAFERVKMRCREGETIPLEYLEKCNAYHEKWLKSSVMRSKTTYINANENETFMPLWLNCVRKIIETNCNQNNNLLTNNKI
jgi:deoxyguanosine kinase|tara:strand:+ start:3017 stop:3694 length:678 start_codon:yes stop_codon:yes gene_type:complete